MSDTNTPEVKVALPVGTRVVVTDQHLPQYKGRRGTVVWVSDVPGALGRDVILDAIDGEDIEPTINGRELIDFRELRPYYADGQWTGCSPECCTCPVGVDTHLSDCPAGAGNVGTVCHRNHASAKPSPRRASIAAPSADPLLDADTARTLAIAARKAAAQLTELADDLVDYAADRGPAATELLERLTIGSEVDGLTDAIALVAATIERRATTQTALDNTERRIAAGEVELNAIAGAWANDVTSAHADVERRLAHLSTLIGA